MARPAAAASRRAPLSLRNSLESWARGGLLDLVDERMIFINSPQAVDYALAKEFDIDVYTTEERNGNIMAGPALSYLVGNASADYVLFMEKDFELSADRAATQRELFLGMHMLARGVDVWRLRGTTDYPAEGMPDCCAPATPPTCPYHSDWKSGGYFSDHQNWLLAFCRPDPRRGRQRPPRAVHEGARRARLVLLRQRRHELVKQPAAHVDKVVQ